MDGSKVKESAGETGKDLPDEGRGTAKEERSDNMDEMKTSEQAIETVANREGKYLTFILAGEDYGIGILKVKEIIGIMAITAVPQTPAYMKGVINLRGKVIPIVDLRVMFGMEAIDYTEKTCIIVVEITNNGQKVMIGILVDSVSEVLNIKGADIEDTPNFGSHLNTNYILGMAKTGGRVKILLEIDRVLSDQSFQDAVSAA
jgi:purine-binding chemotaxis protein CheW